MLVFVMCMSVLPSTCLCTTYVCSTLRGQKRATDSLALECQLRTSMWVLEIKLRASGRAARALHHWANSPAPKLLVSNDHGLETPRQAE